MTQDVPSDPPVLLFQPLHRTRTFGNSVFSSSAPRLWDCLLEGLRDVHDLDTYKRRLKFIRSVWILHRIVVFFAVKNFELNLIHRKGVIELKIA